MYSSVLLRLFFATPRYNKSVITNADILEVIAPTLISFSSLGTCNDISTILDNVLLNLVIPMVFAPNYLAFFKAKLTSFVSPL